MSDEPMTTSVCPACGYHNKVPVKYLAPRYKVPCQGAFCGCVYKIGDDPARYADWFSLIR